MELLTYIFIKIKEAKKKKIIQLAAHVFSLIQLRSEQVQVLLVYESA